MARRKSKRRKQPPFRVIVTAADIDPTERKLRVNRALDILIDEAIRKKGQNKRKR